MLQKDTLTREPSPNVRSSIRSLLRSYSLSAAQCETGRHVVLP